MGEGLVGAARVSGSFSEGWMGHVPADHQVRTIHELQVDDSTVERRGGRRVRRCLRRFPEKGRPTVRCLQDLALVGGRSDLYAPKRLLAEAQGGSMSV